MSDRLYDVIFRGDVAPGESVVEVKQRLAKLFNADAQQVEQLFSGRPVAVKKGVDLLTAERYQQTLQKAGAVVSLKPGAVGDISSEATGAQTVAGATPDGADSQTGLTMADVGADVLSPEDRKDFTPKDVDTSHLTVAKTGADVLAEDEKKPVIERDIDTSHITLDKN